MSERIIYIAESTERPCVIRFVRRRVERSVFLKWLVKPHVEYTLFHDEAFLFNETYRLVEIVDKYVVNDFGCGKVTISHDDDFLEEHVNKKFYVICKWSGNSFGVYFDCFWKGGKALYTKDINSATIFMDEKVANETLQTIRNKNRDKVTVKTIYLNLVNGLLTPMFMILCERKDKNAMSFFSGVDVHGVLNTVPESRLALLLPYRPAMEMYEDLKMHYKDYAFSVLPMFKDNVHVKDLEAYMKSHDVLRVIQMDFKLKRLKYITRHG